mmetsp:Transcript_1876/g.4325  ORF Transcript_1876/g.4325 Transcript_1876/m.4325 type:complete len:346 (-) Transcript_1876:371-1408(-)
MPSVALLRKNGEAGVFRASSKQYTPFIFGHLVTPDTLNTRSGIGTLSGMPKSGLKLASAMFECGAALPLAALVLVPPSASEDDEAAFPAPVAGSPTFRAVVLVVVNVIAALSSLTFSSTPFLRKAVRRWSSSTESREFSRSETAALFCPVEEVVAFGAVPKGPRAACAAFCRFVSGTADAVSGCGDALLFFIPAECAACCSTKCCGEPAPTAPSAWCGRSCEKAGSCSISAAAAVFPAALLGAPPRAVGCPCRPRAERPSAPSPSIAALFATAATAAARCDFARLDVVAVAVPPEVVTGTALAPVFPDEVFANEVVPAPVVTIPICSPSPAGASTRLPLGFIGCA